MLVRTTLVWLLLLSGLAQSGVARAEQPPRPVRVGDRVPDFSVTLSDGNTWKLSELRKRKQHGERGVAVLTFWCSFCHSCRDVERPLDAMAKKYRGKSLVMAIDASVGETIEEVAAFKKKKNLALPIGLDPVGKAADLFGARTTTTTVVIDGQGVLRYFGQFAKGQEQLAEDALKAVLAGDKVRVDHTQQRG